MLHTFVKIGEIVEEKKVGYVKTAITVWQEKEIWSVKNIRSLHDILKQTLILKC